MNNLPWYGIDVSEFQTAIDWNTVKSAGKSFAMIRAGYAKAEDRMFISHFIGAIRAGLHVGVYWFCYAENAEDAALETSACLKIIAPFKKLINMPVAYDFEKATLANASKQGVTLNKVSGTAICKTFAEAVTAEGYIPAIYTGQEYTSNYIDITQFDAALWNAAWAPYDPPIKSNAHRWPIWQYTVLNPDTVPLPAGHIKASLPGVKEPVDLDICYVNYPALYESMQTCPTPPTPKHITLAELAAQGYDGVVFPTNPQ